MFQKTIESIISEGVKGLEALKKAAADKGAEAAAQVQRCQSEIQSLVNLGKQVPDKVFDRYGHVLIGTFEQYNQSSSGLYAVLQIGQSQTQLKGLMGSEDLKPGKYRAIVLLEKLS
jgi:hypothetical protein